MRRDPLVKDAAAVGGVVVDGAVVWGSVVGGQERIIVCRHWRGWAKSSGGKEKEEEEEE